MRVITFSVLLLTSVISSGEGRVWKEVTGASYNAELRGIASGRVYLFKEDGTKYDLPLSDLSLEDRQYLSPQRKSPARIWRTRSSQSAVAYFGHRKGEQVTLLKPRGGTIPIKLSDLSEVDYTLIVSGDAERDPRDRLVIGSDLMAPGEHYVGKVLELADDEVKFLVQGEVTYGKGGIESIESSDKQPVKIFESKEIALIKRTVPTPDAELETLVAQGGSDRFADVIRQLHATRTRHYVYGGGGKLKEVESGLELSEVAIAHYFPTPSESAHLSKLLAVVDGWMGAKSSKKESNIIELLLNATAGANDFVSGEIYARRLFASQFDTQTTEHIELKWDREDVGVIEGLDKRVLETGQSFRGPVIFVETEVTNKRKHPATLYVYGGYFRGGKRFPCDYRFVGRSTHWQARRITLAGGETQVVGLSFLQMSSDDGPATTDDIDVRLLTCRQFADEEFDYDLLQSKELSDLSGKVSDLRQALNDLKSRPK